MSLTIYRRHLNGPQPAKLRDGPEQHALNANHAIVQVIDSVRSRE
jgi:hypothetical protein